MTGLGAKDYCWHEMTFFIHEPDNQEVTVLMFDVPDHEEKDASTSHGQSNGNIISSNPEKSHAKPPFRPRVKSYNFVTELCEELNRCSQSRRRIDLKFMQAVLLKQSITVVDRAVWACSKTVRELEKVCGESETRLFCVHPIFLANHSDGYLVVEFETDIHIDTTRPEEHKFRSKFQLSRRSQSTAACYPSRRNARGSFRYTTRMA